VLSEVVYYLDAGDVARLADRVRASVEPGGHLLLVHWTGTTDYPLSGDDAAECLSFFLRRLRGRGLVLRSAPPAPGRGGREPPHGPVLPDRWPGGVL
jgi:hypothetical protein